MELGTKEFNDSAMEMFGGKPKQQIMEKFFEEQFRMLDRGIVATPNSREDLEAFAKSNQGSNDILLMQMAINFGYKIALENVQEQLQKQSV